MRVVMVGESDAKHICRFHESFRDGIRGRCDTRIYGAGYPGWDRRLKTYNDIIRHVSADRAPDLVIATYRLAPRIEDLRFEYEGFADVSAPKAVVLSDWWQVAGEGRRDGFAAWVLSHGIDLVLCQYPGAVAEFASTAAAERFVWLPICVDPDMFNDWGEPLLYDVGMLGEGVLRPDSFYPERHAFHLALAARTGWRYLTAPHPGYGQHSDKHPLIGRNFSRRINSCRAHVVSGGHLRNPFGKYFETLASRTLLAATEPDGAQSLGLVNGVTYVHVEPETVVDTLAWYFERPELCERIATAGYDLAHRRHTHIARACDLVDLVRARLGSRIGRSRRVDDGKPLRLPPPPGRLRRLAQRVLRRVRGQS